jgi:hypothetical protein
MKKMLSFDSCEADIKNESQFVTPWRYGTDLVLHLLTLLARAQSSKRRTSDTPVTILTARSSSAREFIGISRLPRVSEFTGAFSRSARRGDSVEPGAAASIVISPPETPLFAVVSGTVSATFPSPSKI